jgi:hypothetical protein
LYDKSYVFVSISPSDPPADFNTRVPFLKVSLEGSGFPSALQVKVRVEPFLGSVLVGVGVNVASTLPPVKD